MGWPGRTDAALAGVLGVVTLAITALSAGPDDRPWWPGGAALVILGAVALAWRGRFPLTVLAVTLLVVAPYYWAGYPDGPASLLLAVAVYTVAVRSSVRTSVITGVTVLVAWIGAEQFVAALTGPSDDEDRIVWAIAVVALGVAIGSLRKAQLEAQERAEERARRQVESERLRVAREVHDVVSHSLASIVVQAGVGAHVADRRPDEAVAALLEIKATGRGALDELRGVLSVLRGDDGTETEPPRPELRRLTEIEQVRRVAGLAGVEVVVRGRPGPLPVAVEDTAFRVVQEAVTNTLRHARGATRVEVELNRERDDVAVMVRDDGGPGPAAAPHGHGLRGLAERVAVLHGHLWAGPGDAGFVVEVRLPVEVVT